MDEETFKREAMKRAQEAMNRDPLLKESIENGGEATFMLQDFPAFILSKQGVKMWRPPGEVHLVKIIEDRTENPGKKIRQTMKYWVTEKGDAIMHVVKETLNEQEGM